MAMPRVVAEDDDDDDGSVPRDAVRRRSSPDIKKLTMPLDRICLGVEIIIFQCVTTTMGRRVESSPMEFLVLARRQQIMLARPASQTKFVFVLSAERWPGPEYLECTNRIFVIHRTPNSPPIAPARKKTREKEISPKANASLFSHKKEPSSDMSIVETFRGTGQLPS
jgi:hypothetical protein